MKLELFQDNEFDIIINTDNREVFASIRTLEKVIGCSKEEIIDFADGASMKAIIKTATEESIVDFLSGHQIIMLMDRYNHALLNTLRACGGVRNHFHCLAGFEFN